MEMSDWSSDVCSSDLINNYLTIVTRQSVNDICMLWHSKSAMSMTFMCFGIAKLECQMLTIIGYFFSLSYIPMHGMLKRKHAKKIKSKKNRNDLYMIASVSSRRCESYRMYLKCDSAHQAIMIVCELK